MTIKNSDLLSVHRFEVDNRLTGKSLAYVKNHNGSKIDAWKIPGFTCAHEDADPQISPFAYDQLKNLSCF